MVRWVALVCMIAACQGRGDQPATEPQPPRDDAPLAVPGDAADEPGPGSAQAKPEEPEAPDPGKAIADLGAVPAWQAVVDRGQYLARRGQHGVVYGTLGPPILVPDPTPAAVDAGIGAKPPDAGLIPSEYTWLVDDTEGNGALAIRVKLGAHAASLQQGARVALGGAWELDEDRRYYWNVDAVSPPPPAPPSDLKDPPSPPGHDIQTVDRVPPGSRTISVARDNDLVYFTVVGKPPVVDGDGWPVANELGDPVVALLNLPGERPSFGGQDFRTPDERWQLRRGWLYAVRIGKIRRPGGPDKPANINARTAPVLVK